MSAQKISVSYHLKSRVSVFWDSESLCSPLLSSAPCRAPACFQLTISCLSHDGIIILCPCARPKGFSLFTQTLKWKHLGKYMDLVQVTYIYSWVMMQRVKGFSLKNPAETLWMEWYRGWMWVFVSRFQGMKCWDTCLTVFTRHRELYSQNKSNDDRTLPLVLCPMRVLCGLSRFPGLRLS